MQDTRTHTGTRSVKRKPLAVEDRLESRFRKLDRKAQAYYALWEHSGLSSDAIFLYQYLLNKQGRGTHAFPKVRDILDTYKWNHRRFTTARDELSENLKPVFEIEKGKGKRRDSYKLKHYDAWPVELCRKLWFRSVPNVGTHGIPSVGTQGAVSVTDVGTLYGNTNGDGNYGDGSLEVVEEDSFCNQCGQIATFEYRGRPCCERDGACHQDMAVMF